jgi:hypothetical protein
MADERLATIKVTETTHRLLKAAAALAGKSIGEFVEAALRPAVGKAFRGETDPREVPEAYRRTDGA